MFATKPTVPVLLALCHVMYLCFCQCSTDSAQVQKWSEDFACENGQAIAIKFATFQTNVCKKLLKNEVDAKKVRLFVVNQLRLHLPTQQYNEH